MHRALPLALLALIGVVGPAAARDDGDDPPPPPTSACQVYLNFDGKAATVTLNLRADKKATFSAKDLEQALGGALGGPLKHFRQFGDATTALAASARVEGDFTNEAGDFETTVDLRRLAELLRPLGIKEIDLFAQRTDYYVGRRARFTRREMQHFRPQPFKVSTAAPHPVHVLLGAPPADWHLSAAVAAALLLAPFGLLLWKRREALRAADPAAGWYSFWRWAHWITLATWLGWFTAVPLLEIDILVERLLPLGTGPASGGGLRWAVILVPPWVVMALSTALAQDVLARLKGHSKPTWEVYRQAGAGLLTGMVPLLLVLLGVITVVEVGLAPGGAGLGAGLRAAVPWLLAALVVRFVGGRLAGGEDLTPHAITRGELRDRVFALANQAGVPLTGLYVVPTGKMPEANAFAAIGGNVLLTDQLLRDLSRSEVDGVVAHELAHLKYRHPIWMTGLFLAAIFLPGLLQPMLPHWWQGSWAQHLPIGLLAALGAYMYISRRFEYQTDAYAAWLTGDAEALITGLVKLHRNNLMPLRWGKWEEGMLTHPSTHLRLEAIARQNGVSRKRLDELLAQPAAAGEHYTLPAGVGGPELVFSTAFRVRYSNRNSYGMLAGAVLTPALVAAIVWWGGLQGPARWAALGGGVVLTLIGLLALENYLPVLAYAEARRRLAEKLKGEGTFVSMAPDGEPRIYEGVTVHLANPVGAVAKGVMGD